jgi:hypothetical protein
MLTKWRETTDIIDESWNDDTAKTFHAQNLGEVETVLARVIAALQEAVDTVRAIEKKVGDPDHFD